MIMEEESKTQTQKYYTTTFTSSLLMKNFDYMYHKEIVEKYEGNFKKIKTNRRITENWINYILVRKKLFIRYFC